MQVRLLRNIACPAKPVNMRGLTTCGHVKTFSPLIISTDGSSNAHCFANCSIGDTAFQGRHEYIISKILTESITETKQRIHDDDTSYMHYCFILKTRAPRLKCSELKKEA